jgi:hypothetical protein
MTRARRVYDADGASAVLGTGGSELAHQALHGPGTSPEDIEVLDLALKELLES